MRRNGWTWNRVSTGEQDDNRRRWQERGEDWEGEQGYGFGRRPWTSLVLHCLIMVAAISGGLALYAFQQVETLEERLETQIVDSRERMQALDSLVDFDSRRRTLLLGLRDGILSAGADLNHDQAYQYARLAIEASEKYPSVDPVLLVAIGVVESGYNERAKSPAGALGLYQIIPSTARLLSRSLGWEYTDEMLYDPRKNTELAALYLEVLFAAYNDPMMVLAEYNGGPLNAGYLRAGVSRLSSETSNYVDKVIEVYEGLELQMSREVAADGGNVEAATPEASLETTTDPRPRLFDRGLRPDEALRLRPQRGVESSMGAYLGSLKKAHYPTTPLAGR